MAHTLRPHQRHALRELHDHFVVEGNRRGQYISACGTGKTVVMAMLPTVFTAKTVVVFVPSLNLIEQTWDAFEAQLDGVFDGAILCSDNSRTRHRTTTTGRPAYHTIDTDESDAWDSNERALRSSIPRGSVIHTPDQVAEFLDTPAIAGPPKIIFSTYQSSHILNRGVRLSAAKQIDLVLCDEAHRLASDREDILICNDEDAHEYPPRVVLKLLAAKRFVFATATPKSTSLGAGRSGGGFGMDDERLFGAVAHRYTYAEAVADSVVAPFDIVVAHLDADDDGAVDFLATLGGGTGITNARALISHQAVRGRIIARLLDSLLAAGSVDRALTYSSSIRRAEDLAKDFNRLTPGSARAVSSRTSPAARRAAIAAFAGGELPVITNCRLFGEGHDVPALDAVAFADPKTSTVDIVQALGRATRLQQANPDKRAIVVIPVDNFDVDQIGNVIYRSDGNAAVNLDHAQAKAKDPFAIVSAVLTALDNPGVGLYEASGDFTAALRNTFKLPRTPRGSTRRTPNPSRPSSPLRDKSGIDTRALEALIGKPTGDETPLRTEKELTCALPKILTVAMTDPDPAAQLHAGQADLAAITRYITAKVVDKREITDTSVDLDASILELGRLSNESLLGTTLASARFYRTVKALTNPVLCNDYLQRCADDTEDTIEGQTVFAGLPVHHDPERNAPVIEMLTLALGYSLFTEITGTLMPARGAAPSGASSELTAQARRAAKVYDTLADSGWTLSWQKDLAVAAGYPA